MLPPDQMADQISQWVDYANHIEKKPGESDIDYKSRQALLLYTESNKGSNNIFTNGWLKDLFTQEHSEEFFHQYLDSIGDVDPEQVQEYLNRKRDQEGGLLDGDFYDDFEYDLANQYLQTYKESERQEEDAKLDQQGKKVENIYKQLSEEYPELYDKEIERLEGQLKDYEGEDSRYSASESKSRQDFALADKEIDQLVEAAQQYAASPSVTDAESEAALQDQLRQTIQSKLASRSRYGSLGTSSNEQEAQDRSAQSKSRVAAKLAEKQLRQGTLVNALGTAAGQRSHLASVKDTSNIRHSNIKSNILAGRHRLDQLISDRKLNKPTNLVNAQKALQEGTINRREYEDFIKYQDDETYRAGLRREDASRRKGFGLARGIGGFGLTVAGQPGLGLPLIDSGVNQYFGGQVDSKQAKRPTAGLYGPNTQYFNPQTTYNPGPSNIDFTGSKSKKNGGIINDIYNLGKNIFGG